MSASFSALAAIASAGTLLLVLVIDPLMWSAIRFVSGFCFAGLFTVMESWLNSGVSNQDRARVLALYRIIDIGSVTGAQFLIPVFGADGFAIFAIMSIMITLSLVPVSLGDRSNPAPPEDVKLDLARAWRISPLAAIGCIADRRHQQRLQHAVARLCRGDRHVGRRCRHLRQRRHHRRRASSSIRSATCPTSGTGARCCSSPPAAPCLRRWRWCFSPAPARSPISSLVFVFGSFAMPLFSLSAAHANDRADKGEFVLINAALMLFLFVRRDRRAALGVLLHGAFRPAVALHLLARSSTPSSS